MTRDPIATKVAQPLVDRWEVDPRRGAERFADLFLMAVVTGVAVNVATVTMRPVLLPEAFHLIGGFGVRHICRTAARQGPVYLAVQPYGMIHLVLRIAMFQTLLFALMNVCGAVYVGIAGLVPVSMFRWLLSGTEAVMGLTSLYLSICRRPPPRRRTHGVFSHA
jgi:hypothetical protein